MTGSRGKKKSGFCKGHVHHWGRWPVPDAATDGAASYVGGDAGGILVAGELGGPAGACSSPVPIAATIAGKASLHGTAASAAPAISAVQSEQEGGGSALQPSAPATAARLSDGAALQQVPGLVGQGDGETAAAGESATVGECLLSTGSGKQHKHVTPQKVLEGVKQQRVGCTGENARSCNGKSRCFKAM